MRACVEYFAFMITPLHSVQNELRSFDHTRPSLYKTLRSFDHISSFPESILCSVERSLLAPEITLYLAQGAWVMYTLLRVQCNPGPGTSCVPSSALRRMCVWLLCSITLVCITLAAYPVYAAYRTLGTLSQYYGPVIPFGLHRGRNVFCE